MHPVVAYVLAQPTVLSKSAERPLHDPPCGHNHEAFRSIRPFDDLPTHLPIASEPWHPGLEQTGVRAIRPATAQAGAPVAQEPQEVLGAISILHVSGRHHHRDEQPQRVYEDMALTPVDLLGTIAPMVPPRSVVLTDCASIIPALGCRARPVSTRRSPRKTSLIRVQGPSLRQRQK
jgi:hypothetical protein